MKPRILICSDSAFIDTGFGRVAREIGTGLVKAGFHVTQLGWFHSPNDKVVPFRVIPTMRADYGDADSYGQLSYDTVLEQVRPDMVLAIGDVWMVEHMVMKERDHKLVCYVPIDSEPIMHSWVRTFALMDLLVVFGNYAERVIKDVHPNFFLGKIPHGVDIDVFKPMFNEERAEARKMLGEDRFVVGCVGRNNVRKQIPRLIEAFKKFISPWVSCNVCGSLSHVKELKWPLDCPECDAPRSMKDDATNEQIQNAVSWGDHKKDALLYLHCALEDPAGHKLSALIDRAQIHNQIAMPSNYIIGRGVPDWQMNKIYNAFDVFTLPTSGEGWGLPILEAMSAGCPVLVTDYSAHVDYVQGAGELIQVSDWWTEPTNNCKRALTDIDDHVMKLDRFYYDRNTFKKKWGNILKANGLDLAQLDKMDFGVDLRVRLSAAGHERAQDYSWDKIVKTWVNLVTRVVGTESKHQEEQGLQLQVI